ncbi:MAG: hypothetical protein Q9207_003575, partial [Kuettlingeria erythrocarpa]
TPYTLPFQNLKSRALVRIVDFFPPNIADFAVRKREKSEFDVLSECSADSSSSEDDQRRRPLPDDTETEEENDAASQRADDDNNADHTPKWEWRFALVLEDASSSKPTSTTPPTERLTAYVTEADAVFLLKLDACNLRRKSQALAALREKLFLLWGDLEERKETKAAGEREEQAEPKSMPFECCIKEYGVRSRRRAQVAADHDPSGGERDGHSEGHAGGGRGEENNWGWERKFAMFGTTIL